MTPPTPPLPEPHARRARIALLAAPLLLGALLAGAPVARAQRVAQIPENAEAGRLKIGVFPEATLDGRPIRLGPGTRIYDERNMIVPPGGLSGERKVGYVRGTQGEVVQAWLLSDAEFRALSDRVAAARRAAAGR